MDAETFAEAQTIMEAFDADDISHPEMILGVSAITGWDRNAVEYFANQLAMIRYHEDVAFAAMNV